MKKYSTDPDTREMHNDIREKRARRIDIKPKPPASAICRDCKFFVQEACTKGKKAKWYNKCEKFTIRD